MNSTENGVMPTSRWMHCETLSARLAKGRPLVDQEVRVTVVENANHKQWVGVEGRLLQVDVKDATLPFLVDVRKELVEGGLWVHDIEPVDPEAPFKVGDRVDLARIAIGRVTQAGTVIQAYAAAGTSKVDVVWDGSLGRIGPSGAMTEYADNWTAGRLRPLTEEEQTAHPMPARMRRWLRENAPRLAAPVADAPTAVALLLDRADQCEGSPFVPADVGRFTAQALRGVAHDLDHPECEDSTVGHLKRWLDGRTT